MTLAQIDLESFCRALDLHGADLARWPQPLADQAGHFLADSSQAQDAWRLAQSIEAAITEAHFAPGASQLPTTTASAPPGLASRIKASVPHNEPLAPAWHWLLRVFSRPMQGAFTATMACVPLVAGIWLGTATDFGLSLEQNLLPDQSLVNEVDGLLFSLDDHFEVLTDDT